MKSNKHYTVYMLKCSDGSYYTGITKDLERRLKVHASGKGSKYVRSRLPFELVYSGWAGSVRSWAQKQEAAIKKLSHHDKQELIKFYMFLTGKMNEEQRQEYLGDKTSF